MDSKFIILSFIFSISIVSAIDFGQYVNPHYEVYKTGNESNYSVTINYSSIDNSTLIDKIMNFVFGDELKTERIAEIEICSPEFIDKKELILYEKLPKKNKEGELLKEIDKIEKDKDLKKQYCYSDILDPEKDLYVKYGNNSIVLEVSYNFTSDTINEDTITESGSNIHLEINTSSSPYDSLVAYYSFDTDNSTIAYDLTANSKDGTYTNGAYANSSCSSLYGYASCFDGYTLNSSINLNGLKIYNMSNFSWGMWIKGNNLSIREYVLSTGNGISGQSFYGFGKESGNYNKLRVFIRDQSGNILINNNYSTATVFDGHWHHIFVTDSNGNYKLYIDGNLDTSYNYTHTLLLETANYIGSSYTSPTLNSGFNGSIDEVMIFNTSLTSQQISEIYNNQSERFKDFGNVTFKSQKLNHTGYNEVLLNFTCQENLNSYCSSRVGWWTNSSQGYNDSVDGNVDPSLVLWYHMDNRTGYENDTHAFDFSGNGNNGSVLNSPELTDGYFENSYEFNGVNGGGTYINVTESDSMDTTSNGFTLCTWFRPAYTLVDEPNRWYYFFKDNPTRIELGYQGWNDEFEMKLLTNSTLHVLYDPGFTGGVWQHACFMINNSNSTLAIYSNGEVGAVSNLKYIWNGSYFGYENPINYGIGGIGGASAWNGTIDEVKIWNRSLTADEIKNEYIKGSLNYNYTDFNTNKTHTIPIETTQILPEVKLTANTTQGNVSFYSPYVTNFSNYELIDTIDPYFTSIPSNISQLDNQIISAQFEASDNVAIDTFSLNWTSYFTINSTGFLTNSSIVPTGIYEINVSVNDTDGNTNQTAYRIEILNSTSCGIFLNDSTSIIFGQQIIVYTNCTSSYNMYLNGSEISNASVWRLGAGYYNFSVIRQDQTNFSEYYNELFLTINKSSSNCSVSVNNPTYPNPAQASGSCDNPEASEELFKDDVLISNPYTEILAAGSYTIEVNVSETDNYTSATDSDTLTIDKATGIAYAYISNVLNLSARSNQTIYNGTSVWLNASRYAGQSDQTLYLYFNNTLINQDSSSPIGNWTLQNDVGTYNVTAILSAGQNYTADYETWWLKVLEIPVSQCTTEFDYVRAASSNGRPIGRLCTWNDFR